MPKLGKLPDFSSGPRKNICEIIYQWKVEIIAAIVGAALGFFIFYFLQPTLIEGHSATFKAAHLSTGDCITLMIFGVLVGGGSGVGVVYLVKSFRQEIRDEKQREERDDPGEKDRAKYCRCRTTWKTTH